VHNHAINATGVVTERRAAPGPSISRTTRRTRHDPRNASRIVRWAQSFGHQLPASAAGHAMTDCALGHGYTRTRRSWSVTIRRKRDAGRAHVAVVFLGGRMKLFLRPAFSCESRKSSEKNA